MVTKEVYQRTFEEIEAVIAELNAIIRAGDFAAWEKRLTAAYRERTASPEYLAEVSAEPAAEAERRHADAASRITSGRWSCRAVRP